MEYAAPIARLIAELERLPGVGPKTAQRLALHLLNRPREEVAALASALLEAKDRIHPCSVCANLTDTDPCAICGDPRRDESLLCVVEEPKDVIALERTHEFHGRYHVLMGAISPLSGVGPDDLRIEPLLARLKEGKIREVVLATDPDVEGEATAMYLARLLKPLGVKTSRLARGLPEGGDLDYVDEVTLARALEGRRAI
ncbi:MAG: recombination mediator RecR [Bacillota bacterium]|nr:recombination mediator RecR [Bacillota bacterium]